MHSTELVLDLFETCRAETVRLLEGFEAAPSRSGLFDVGAVAEIVVLGDTFPGIETLRTVVCDSAARWLRQGILEELCFARAELTYYAALLAFMAQRGTTYQAADMTVLKRLCEGNLIGRSEMPVLTQQLTAAYLTRCGIAGDFGDLGRRDLAKMIDKRVLRPRLDEYDLLVLIMCAQLLRLERNRVHSRPFLYPQTLLMQVVRSANLNWLPVLVFLCASSFAVDKRLVEASFRSVLQALPPRGELLPAPLGVGIESEYIGRAGRGLRIRSTIALAFSLSLSGDLNDKYRTSLAIA